MKLKAKRLLSLLVCMPLLCGVILFTGTRTRASAAESYTVTTYDRKQTYEGWGTSLIWWANNVGKYTWQGASGKQVREEIMELIYGEDGLEYNIARFNVGGGDNPGHSHVRTPQDMPGYSVLDPEKAHEYLPEYDESEGNAGVNAEIAAWNNYKNGWNIYKDVTYKWELDNWEIDDEHWDADQSQRWCMEWIYENAVRKNELITEYFSNSPPWYMTESACSSGNLNGAANIISNRAKDFARYFADVLDYLITEEGYHFDYVNPFNESTSDWWGVRSEKQEGCKMTNQQRADVLYYLVQILDDDPVFNGIKIAFDDSTGADLAWGAYDALVKSNRWDAIKHRIGKLNYHLYEGSQSSEIKLANAANENGWSNWMSEMGYKSNGGSKTSPLQTGFLHSEKIRQTINSGAKAYVVWQIIEELSTSLDSLDYGYGPVKVSYYSAEQQPALKNFGYDLGSYYVSPQYYVLGQYSKYIKPGYTIIGSSDPSAVTAISPERDKVIIVHENQSTKAQDITYTLNGSYIKSAQVVLTDATHSWSTSSLAATGTKFSYTVPASSVTTFVLDTAEYMSEPIDESGWELTEKDYTNMEKTQLATMPDAATISNAGSTYALNKLYLTKEWGGGGSGDKRFWVEGGKEQGGFVRLTGINGVRFKFRQKGANDGTDINFDVYEKTDSGYKKLGKTDKVNNGGKDGTTAALWQRLSLDEKKEYLVRFEVMTSGKWTDVVSYVRITGDTYVPEYEGPALDAATVKDGKLYVSIKDAAPSDTFTIGWCATDSFESQSVTKQVSQLNEPVVTGLRADAYNVWIVDAGGNYSETKTVRNASVDPKLLYYVDAGAPDASVYNVFERAGTLSTYKDQPSGVDQVTGKKWGRKSEGNTAYASGESGSIYQSLGNILSTDPESGTTAIPIEYEFEVENGTYDILLGAICPWAARPEEVFINGDSVGTFNIDGSVNYISITGVEPVSGFITIKVAKSGTEGALLGTILIAEHDAPTDVFVSAAAATEPQVTGAAAGVKHYRLTSVTSLYSAAYNITSDTEVFVYGTDGVKRAVTVADGVTFNRYELESYTPNTEVARLSGSYNGLCFNDALTLTSTAATVYYFVDCGSDGTAAAPPGTNQNGKPDQKASGGSWGYTGDGTAGWSDNNYIGSIIYGVKDASYYTFTGLPSGTALTIEVGGNDSGGWGAVTYDVYFGTSNAAYNNTANKNIGTVTIAKGESGVMTKVGHTIPAETCYMFFHKTSGGQDPFLSYIKIMTNADPVPAKPNVDVQEARWTDTVTVSNLTVGDVLVVSTDDGSVVGEKKITAETMQIDLGEFAFDTLDQSVLFYVRHDGSVASSDPATVLLPRVVVSGITEGWTNRNILHFKPSLGTTLQKLVIEENGRKTDVTAREYFYYVVSSNTVLKAYYTTSLNETYVQEIDISNINFITFRAEYDTALTTSSLQFNLVVDAPNGLVKEFYIDGVQKDIPRYSAKDKGYVYPLTVDENATYHLKAISTSGELYEYDLVIDNIDKLPPTYAIDPIVTDASGFNANLVAVNPAGGTFVVTKGDETYGVYHGLHLFEAGEYSIRYTANIAPSEVKNFKLHLVYSIDDLTKTTVTKNGTNVTVTGNAVVYRLGTGEQIEGTSGTYALTDGYRYLVLVRSGDDYEALILTMDSDPITPPAPKTKTVKEGCGSAAAAAYPAAALVLLLGAAVLAILKKGGKRA